MVNHIYKLRLSTRWRHCCTGRSIGDYSNIHSFLRHKQQCIQFGHIQQYRRNVGIQDQAECQDYSSIVSIKWHEIRWEHDQPQKQCSGDRYKYKPGFIEVFWQLSSSKSKQHAAQGQGNVEGHWYQECNLWEIAETFHIWLAVYGHEQISINGVHSLQN